MWEKGTHVVGWIADATDLVAAIMIMIGFVRGVVAWLRAEFGSGAMRWKGIQGARCALGTYILLGIEFMIVSDILHSCVHKDLESLAELGALVVIRTVISFFLGKELESVHGEETAS
jgi:uncharacterized membrane protein